MFEYGDKKKYFISNNSITARRLTEHKNRSISNGILLMNLRLDINPSRNNNNNVKNSSQTILSEDPENMNNNKKIKSAFFITSNNSGTNTFKETISDPKKFSSNFNIFRQKFSENNEIIKNTLTTLRNKSEVEENDFRKGNNYSDGYSIKYNNFHLKVKSSDRLTQIKKKGKLYSSQKLFNKTIGQNNEEFNVQLHKSRNIVNPQNLFKKTIISQFKKTSYLLNLANKRSVSLISKNNIFYVDKAESSINPQSLNDLNLIRIISPNKN